MTPARFTRTTIPEKESLGEKLAKKRNSLHLDIKDVEKAIKIPAKHLRAMEDGHYSILPPDVYVRGFLKNYSLYLGLDPKKMIDIYKKEVGLENKMSEVKKKSTVVKPIHSPRVFLTPKKIIVGGAIAGIFAVVFFIAWQIKILTAPPALTLLNPPENMTTNDDYVLVEGRTDKESDLFINDVLIGTNDTGSFKERVNLQNGLNVLKVKAKNKMNRETILERTVMAKLPENPTVFDRATYPVELKIVIGPNTAWLQLVRDGEKLNISGIMLPGSTHTFYAKSDIVVTTNNGGSTKVFLNGKDLGPMGKEGEEVKDRKYTK